VTMVLGLVLAEARCPLFISTDFTIPRFERRFECISTLENEQRSADTPCSSVEV
jgi:hypothetical protein